MLGSCNNNNHCGNGVQDGDETGVDCGGSCVNLCSTPSGTAGYWMFDLTINGVNHKAEGYQSDNPNYSWGDASSHNHCISFGSMTSSSNTVYMGVVEQSSSSYVSGDYGLLDLAFPNLSLGVCDAGIGHIFSTYFPTNGSATCHPSNGFTFAPTETGGLLDQTVLPVNITDLGTATSGDIFLGTGNYGAPVLGNYSGTIYLCSGANPPGTFHYDFPVTIDLEFIAQRYPQ